MSYNTQYPTGHNQHAQVSDRVARDLIENSFACFTPKMSMEEAVSIIIENNTTGGPVLGTDGQLVGFLSERDCLRMAMESRYHNFHGGLVEGFMRDKVFTIPEDMRLFDIVDNFIDHWFHLYPVVDKKQRVIGVIARKKVLKTIQQLKGSTW